MCITSGGFIVPLGFSFPGHREGKTCRPPQAQLCHVSRRDGVPFSVYDGRPRQESAGGRSEALCGEERPPPRGDGSNQGAPNCTSLSRGTRRLHGGIKRRGGLLHSQLRGHGHGQSHGCCQPSRQGHRRHARQKKDKLRAAFAYRGAEFSSSSAKTWAAADDAGGLTALPDNEHRRGRDVVLGVDTPLKKIQTVLSAHGAARLTTRALLLAASPMRLRAPATTPSSRLVANGVVQTFDTMTAPSTAGPSVEAAGSEPNVASLLDALGVFDQFKKRCTIKDEAVYLGLVKKVLVEEGTSGAVLVDAGISVSDLVGLFEAPCRMPSSGRLATSGP